MKTTALEKEKKKKEGRKDGKEERGEGGRKEKGREEKKKVKSLLFLGMAPQLRYPDTLSDWKRGRDGRPRVESSYEGR